MKPTIIQEIRQIRNPWKKFWVYSLSLAIILTSISLATKPLRYKWSENYRISGDSFLSSKQYLRASLEYKKSLMIFKGNTLALDHDKLAKSGADSVSALTDFYKERFDLGQLGLINKASQPSQSVAEQTKMSKELLEKNEYQLSILAAATATQMDQNYRDAWLYLGIANLKAAQFVELTVEQQKTYLEAAAKALASARKLDSEYPIIITYAKAVDDSIRRLQ